MWGIVRERAAKNRLLWPNAVPLQLHRNPKSLGHFAGFFSANTDRPAPSMEVSKYFHLFQYNPIFICSISRTHQFGHFEISKKNLRRVNTF